MNFNLAFKVRDDAIHGDQIGRRWPRLQIRMGLPVVVHAAERCSLALVEPVSHIVESLFRSFSTLSDPFAVVTLRIPFGSFYSVA